MYYPEALEVDSNTPHKGPLKWHERVWCNTVLHLNSLVCQKPAPSKMSLPDTKQSDRPIIKEIKGDLFTAPETHALAHCVSRCFTMGAGIAEKFREKFGSVSELLSQKRNVGETACLTCHLPNSGESDKERCRYIFYLVTKDKYYHKPTYTSLRSALLDMRSQAVKLGIKHIAMPRIGCGLDRLEWPLVCKVLEELFTADFGIYLDLYLID